MADWLELLEWPAMLSTVLASWLVASSRPGRRHAGFWVFLLSNLLWVAWGWQSGAIALVVMQFCLAAMNIRGARKTEAGSAGQADGAPVPPVAATSPGPSGRA